MNFKKQRKGKLKRFDYNKRLCFGTIGLQAIESGNLTSRQLEAARQSINRKIKRSGKLWSRVSLNYPVTRKPLETRMGKGKGSINHWSSKVAGGTIIFELCGVSFKKALPAFKTGKAKLSVKTRIIF